MLPCSNDSFAWRLQAICQVPLGRGCGELLLLLRGQDGRLLVVPPARLPPLGWKHFRAAPNTMGPNPC